MKIIYFIEEAKLGGPQVQMVRVAAALAGRMDIEIVMPEDNSEAFRQLCDDNKVPYRTFPISRLTKELGPLVTFFVRSPFEIVKLVRYIGQEDPELIHAWGGSWQVKAAMLARFSGVPLVWLINDTQVPSIVMTVFRFFARFSSGFIFASHRSADYYRNQIPKITRATVIQSLVDLDDFNPVKKYAGDEEFIGSLGAETVIGVIANISPVKGIETFIRVAARAQASGQKARFIVIGKVYPRQREYFEGLNKMCSDLGVTNLSFVGARQDVRAILCRFDIYLCTSIAESSPVAVWEAMAMGCPVVSTDVGDVPRFVRNGESGFVESVSDDLALWQSVKMLCNNNDLLNQLGVGARAVANESFGGSIIAKQTAGIYQDVLAK